MLEKTLRLEDGKPFECMFILLPIMEVQITDLK